jgi:hypothetical protein
MKQPEDWQKKYRWRRTWPDETDLDGKPFEDYCAFDGDLNAGRIRLDRESLKKGQWRWSGSYPPSFRGSPIMPNAGYARTAADAAKAAEEYWDRMKSRRETGR